MHVLGREPMPERGPLVASPPPPPLGVWQQGQQAVPHLLLQSHRFYPMAAVASSPPFPRATSALRPLLVSSGLRFRPSPAAVPSHFSVGHGSHPWPGFRCRAAAGPSPPSSEPPPPHGWQERLSRLQDRIRIFFAVLFWMALFFWGSAWDGNNNSGGTKRQRFRKNSK
uniref:Uncharacterized protein n=1 Tax=Oryza brachyantha TaxID=4533 RepID=J3L072_ORYBR